MPTVRLSKKIADYVTHFKKKKRYGGCGSMSRLISESIKFLLNKHLQCFSCEFHKDQVVGLSLGRQKVAIEAVASGRKPMTGGKWFACPKSLLKKSQAIGDHMGLTGKQVIEQAIFEHITRPSQCDGCPFYAEMKKSIEAQDKAGTDPAPPAL